MLTAPDPESHVYDKPPAHANADWTIDQNWSGYSDEEHATWDTLFERQRKMLPGRAAQAFLRTAMAPTPTLATTRNSSHDNEDEATTELTATLMLSPIGFKNLATRAWTGYEAASFALVGTPGLLLLAGTADPWVPEEDMAALEAAGVEVVRYDGADHGFAHDPTRDAHRADDAADAWRRAIAHLSAS